jgi:16S rRNA processing protein RimM
MAQTVPDRFIEIGRIGKPRGLDGTVRFLPNQNFIDGLFEQVVIFYVRNNRSDLVPARLEDVHLEKKRNQQMFFVQFDLIASRNDAEAAMDKALFVERSVVEEMASELEYESDESDTTDFTGYEVEYNGAFFGTVLDVMENPAHPILEVKHKKGAVLIPFVDEFVESANESDKMIICKNLDQLIEK